MLCVCMCTTVKSPLKATWGYTDIKPGDLQFHGLPLATKVPFFHQGFCIENIYLQLMFYFGDGPQHALWQYIKMVVEEQETFVWPCIYVQDLGRS